MTQNPSPKDDEADDGESENTTSLDRLRELTRKVVAVPKDEVDEAEKRDCRRKRRKQAR